MIDRLREQLEPALCAAALGATAAIPVAMLQQALRSWSYLDRVYVWVPGMFGHDAWVWLVGATLPAAGLAWLLARGRGDRTWLRVLLWAWALGAAGWTTAAGVIYGQDAPLADTLLMLIPGFVAMLAASWVASGKVRHGDRSRPAFAATVAAAIVLLVHGGAVQDQMRRATERAQLRDATIELVAVYTFDARWPPVEPDLVEANGTQYQLVRGESLTLHAPEDIAWVEWVEAEGLVGLTIATRGDAVAKVARRADDRLSRGDAILVNGELMSVPTYQGPLLDGALYISNTPDQAESLCRLFAALTTAPTPATCQ